jgi:hypothetical protein
VPSPPVACTGTILCLIRILMGLYLVPRTSLAREGFRSARLSGPFSSLAPTTRCEE